MRVVLPFKLIGQKLVNGRDFPKSIADGSKNTIVVKVDGLPESAVTKAYFKLSWENATTYDLTFNGSEVVLDEYIVTLPTHANNKYVDYKISMSIAIFDGNEERLTTDPVELVLNKSNYSDETTNTPEIPQSQYDELAAMTADAKAAASAAGSTATIVNERITKIIAPKVDEIGENVDSLNAAVFGTPASVREIRNAFNPSDPDVATGKYASGLSSSGKESWTTSADWNETGFIPVTGERLYIYLSTASTKYATSRSVILYDSNKTPLTSKSTADTGKKYYTIPEGVAYVRAPFKTSDAETMMLFFNNADDPAPASTLDYAPYNNVVFDYETPEVKGLFGEFEDRLSEQQEQIDALTEQTAGLVGDVKELQDRLDDEGDTPDTDLTADVEALNKAVFGIPASYRYILNALNPDDPDVINGKFYDYATEQSDGSFKEHTSTNSAWNESGYVPVTGKRFYMYLNDTNAFTVNVCVVYYDENKKCVGYSNATEAGKKYYVIPDGVAYVRFAWKEARRTAMIAFFTAETDTVPLRGYEYVPYNEVVLTFKDTPAVNGLVQDVENLKNGGVPSSPVSHWDGLKWYAYGTSLTSTAQGKYATYVADMAGLTLTNKGIPGGGIISNTQVKEAVMNTTDGKLDADLITLEVGANDMSAVLGTIYDTGDATFCGALNQCIRYLQANTTAQIVVISSTNSKTNPPEYEVGTDKHTKYDQWVAIEGVCKVNGVPYIPMGETAGLGYSRMTTDYLVDNIHHTQLGGYNLAQFVWSRLKNIPKWYTELPA